MTRKERIECDGTWCGSEEVPPQVAERSSEWVEMDFDGTVRHFCPECSWRLLKWATDGRSAGEYFVVKHSYIGERFEEAFIGPGVTSDHVSKAGTHSLAISPFHDERDKFENYLRESMEGWHVHVHDHVGLTILGEHKGCPRVVLEPEEYSTEFLVRETGSGHSFDKLFVEDGIDIERVQIDA